MENPTSKGRYIKLRAEEFFMTVKEKMGLRTVSFERLSKEVLNWFIGWGACFFLNLEGFCGLCQSKILRTLNKEL